jgi:hypothetical protein
MAVITNKLYKYLLVFLVALFIQTPIYANCGKSYTLGFFNGVWNTQDQATSGRDELRILIRDTYNNEPVKYEVFYNHTGSTVGSNGLQDLAETFIQRSAEIDASGELGRRFEYFWEFIGSSEPTFIDKIKGIFSNAISLFESLYTAVNTKLVAIISYFASHPPTEADYATHNAQLDALAANGEKLMLVGHSQGNLFMNHAYDHILPTIGADRVKAAHIAPASPTLRGDWVLANIDLVINLLRVQGLTSVPANNLDINASRVDVSGHTLIGTYLDPMRDGRAKVKTMIETGMGKLKCPIIPHDELYIYDIGWDNPNGEWTHDILTFCGYTGINLFGTNSIVINANLSISGWGCRQYVPASPFVTVVNVHIHSDGSVTYGDSADGEINDFLSMRIPIVDKR